MSLFFRPMLAGLGCCRRGMAGLGDLAKPAPGSPEYIVWHAWTQNQMDVTAPRITFQAFLEQWCRSSMRCKVEAGRVVWAAGEAERAAKMTSATSVQGEQRLDPKRDLNVLEAQALVKRAEKDKAAGGSALTPYSEQIAKAAKQVGEAVASGRLKPAVQPSPGFTPTGEEIQPEDGFKAAMVKYWPLALAGAAALAWWGVRSSDKSEAMKARGQA